MPDDHPRTTAADVTTLLLSAVSGSLDAVAVLTLGQVFASVMTGNLVLLGVAAGTGDGGQARSVGVALLGYAVGTGAGALMARAGSGIAPVLALEAVPFAGFAVLWELADGSPAGGAQHGALLAAATTMGIQSAAALQLHGGPATTYFTGTLTGLVADLVREGRLHGWALARIGSLLLAAGVAGSLIDRAPRVVVVLPGLALLAALLTAYRTVPSRNVS